MNDRTPYFPIELPKKFSGRADERARQDLYRAAYATAILIAGFALIAGAVALLPARAAAFWPFSSNADAQTIALLPSAATPVLAAATNLDPNPTKALGALATAGDSALVAHSGPGGTLADVINAPSSDRISVYVVRPGDTLSEIAGMFGVSVNTIVWANNLGGVRAVHPGDTLVILPVSGVERTVAKGDTLKSIAKKYGADADEIAQFNGLDPSAPLAVGSTVIIPGGELAASAPAAPRRRGAPRGPYLGGGGASLTGYFGDPMPGGIITQGIHGWNGVDIGAARGTPIRAAAAGVVIVARNNGLWNGGYGNYIVIVHDNGTETLYAHLAHGIVAPGQSVFGGQTIGYEGATGEATGVHLHFEVRGAANPFRDCPVGSVCAPE